MWKQFDTTAIWYDEVPLLSMSVYNNNNNNIAFFSQASWGSLEMKPERNKFKVQTYCVKFALFPEK